MRILCLLPVVALAVGCDSGRGDRPRLVTASGKVMFQGKPLVPGVLTFHPPAGVTYNGDRPSCQIGADGSFVAKTYPHGEGVPPGTYKVTLSADIAGRIKRPQYADPGKTPLQLVVPEGGATDQTLEVK